MFKKILYSSCLAFVLTSNPALSYQVKEGGIVDGTGQFLQLDGLNWAGFQDGGFVDEAYGGIPFFPIAKPNQPAITIGLLDMLLQPEKFSEQTGITKDNAVRFKTIRLTIQPSNLTDNTANNHFRLDLTDAKNKTAGNGVFCKSWGQESCAEPLSVSESLFKLLHLFKDNHLRVLIDFHQNPQGRNGNVVVPDLSLQDYQNAVRLLATRIRHENLDNVLAIDVFNEPHNLKWF